MSNENGRNKHARRNLGHTESVLLKLHPDLLAYVKWCAAHDYRSEQEVVRSFILAAMRSDEAWQRERGATS